jgi:hypothetical protein
LKELRNHGLVFQVGVLVSIYFSWPDIGKSWDLRPLELPVMFRSLVQEGCSVRAMKSFGTKPGRLLVHFRNDPERHVINIPTLLPFKDTGISICLERIGVSSPHSGCRMITPSPTSGEAAQELEHFHPLLSQATIVEGLCTGLEVRVR